MAKTVDVVIVGGGVVGSSIAYNLKNDGFTGSVVVLEKDPSYQYASSSLSMGGVRQQFGHAVNVLLVRYSVGIYEQFDQLMAVDGEPAHAQFRQRGYMFLANEKNAPILERRYQLQKSVGADVEILSREEIHRRFPELWLDDILWATFGPRDGYVDPHGVLQGFRRKARSLGAVYEADEVVGIEVRDGKVEGVRTKKGEHYQTRIVVNAAGPSAKLVGAMAGVQLPIEPVRQQLFVCALPRPWPYEFPMIIDPDGVHWRHETGNKIIVAKTKHDEPPGFRFGYERERFHRECWPDLARRVPEFDRLVLERGWGGLYAMTPDQNAIYGEHPEVKGFYMANGFSGHGLMMSPATGKVMSELIRLGRYETVDVSELNVERFAQGKLVLEEALI
ncbi:MAG: FAD-binding oxidoreductase [Nitrospinota bacterium]|nr:MAG: FAD-binding oxidoreductase [Nitrospinota bacterium]